MGYLDNILKQIQQLNLDGVKAEGVKRNNGNAENINIGNMLRGNGIGGTDYANNNTNSISSEALEQFTAKTPETRINPDGSGTNVTTKTDKNGNNITTVDTLAAGGKVLNRSTIVKTKSGEFVSQTKTDFEYDENGKLKKNKSVQKTKNETITTTRNFNENGKVANAHTDVEMKDKGKTYKHYTDTKFEYKDGKLTKRLVSGKNIEGKPFSITDNYEADGKTLKNRTHDYYKRGALYHDVYDGANLTNRTQGGVPTTRIEYEADGKTVKHTIKNKFDADGVLLGREKFNKNGNVIEKKDFSQLDGKFDTAYQIGKGDCYLLASINALSQTEEGQKLLQQNVKVSTNDKGEKVYTISFPGAANAREALISGKGNASIGQLPEDKVHIQGSYTITEAELNDAAKRAGKDYSAGDKDVLLLEVAYDKYRKDVAHTIKDNHIDPKKTKFVAGLGISNVSGDTLSGGNVAEATYILTGKKSFVYMNKSNIPTCYVDSNMQMHILEDENGNRVKAGVMVVENNQNANFDSILDNLRKDSADGKIDNFAASVGFIVSSQEVNGSTIQGGGHALTIRKVTENEVILSNPWDPDTDIVMSITDLKKAAGTVYCTQLNATSQTSQAPQTSQPQQPPQSPPTSPTSNGGGINPSSQPQQGAEVEGTKYKVQEGDGYIRLLRKALKDQGIEPTAENLKKAKEQFMAANKKGTVRKYEKGPHKEWYGNEYLLSGAEVIIPKFKM